MDWPTLATTDAAAWLQALGRFHVAIVHFPIALLILAACVELVRLARRKSGPSPVSIVCLIVGLISAIAAAAAGWFHKEYVSFGGQQAAVLDWHQWMGIAATALAAAAAIALVFRGTRGAVYRGAVVTCAVLVVITSHLGGTLTHGPGYLTELLTTPR